MNVTELAGSLLEPVPAHRTPGTWDVRTDDPVWTALESWSIPALEK